MKVRSQMLRPRCTGQHDVGLHFGPVDDSFGELLCEQLDPVQLLLHELPPASSSSLTNMSDTLSDTLSKSLSKSLSTQLILHFAKYVIL